MIVVGDILVASQVAWKIGRAFSAGGKHAPADFQGVETDISGLAKALKLLAEAIHADADKSLFLEADKEIQDGIGLILSSCQRTVSDLESLVDHYQVIKKHPTVGGFAIERSWSELVLADYRTTIWTTEGGNLQNLRDLLRMHTSSITLLMQALQSKSPSRLQTVVVPMAERIDSMYHSSDSLDQQLDEVHRVLQDLTTSAPTTQVPPVPIRNPARSPSLWSPTLAPSSPPGSPLQRQDNRVSLPRAPHRPGSPVQPSIPGPRISILAPSFPTETMDTSGASSPTRKRFSEFSSGSYAPSEAGKISAEWPSPGPLRDSFINRQPSTSTKKTTPLPRMPESPVPDQRADADRLSLLPPPAMGPPALYEFERITSHSSYPSTQADIMKLHRSSTTASQKAAFEKEAFRNSAILCDIRGKLVEYSHQINEDDPRDVEMVEASDECRIAVIRKRIHDPDTKSMRLVTSIWAFSDDGTVRMELRMDDDQMYIPYSSYFSQCKASITVPCELKFHDVRHGHRLAKKAKTSWVNYVFDTPQSAALFQNELMGRTLLATFRTKKTMRIHEGLGKTFSYAEQMCALENLRVWEDNDTSAIIALIHFSASFRNGYLAFYLNSSVNPIRVKDDGNRVIKIKGLRVPIDRGDRAMRKDSVVVEGAKGKEKSKEAGGKEKAEKEKVISGAKIEFTSEAEKGEFLAMVEQVQTNMIELPDLLGVN